MDPVTGEEIHGNDVEGVLAIKKPWPSMARTIWGAHKRYMDTYFNVYKGFYVSHLDHGILIRRLTATPSSQVMVPVEITKDITGSVVVLTTW